MSNAHLTLEAANKLISKKQALGRLLQNPDFKAVVLDGYFKDECVRLVMAKGTPSMDSPEAQAAVIRDIDSISSFKGYLQVIEHEANLAEKAIEDHNEDVSDGPADSDEE